MTAHDTREPNCAGRWELFDSTDLADHAEARDLCSRCPVLLRCAQQLRAEQEATAGLRGSGGGPSGTWAGKLLGRKGYGTRQQVECGTDGGYYHHVRVLKETACKPCRTAHANANRKRAQRARKAS